MAPPIRAQAMATAAAAATRQATLTGRAPRCALLALAWVLWALLWPLLWPLL